MSAKHFVFRRHAILTTPQGVIVGRSEISVPEDVISKIPMSVTEARELLRSLTPGTLHLLHEGGGSPRFSRALQVAGQLK